MGGKEIVARRAVVCVRWKASLTSQGLSYGICLTSVGLRLGCSGIEVLVGCNLQASEETTHCRINLQGQASQGTLSSFL